MNNVFSSKKLFFKIITIIGIIGVVLEIFISLSSRNFILFLRDIDMNLFCIVGIVSNILTLSMISGYLLIYKKTKTNKIFLLASFFVAILKMLTFVLIYSFNIRNNLLNTTTFYSLGAISWILFVLYIFKENFENKLFKSISIATLIVYGIYIINLLSPIYQQCLKMNILSATAITYISSIVEIIYILITLFFLIILYFSKEIQ